jgi:hypothetical protein
VSPAVASKDKGDRGPVEVDCAKTHHSQSSTDG